MKLNTHDKLYRRGEWAINAHCLIVGASYMHALVYACLLRRHGEETYRKPILERLTNSYRPLASRRGEA